MKAQILKIAKVGTEVEFYKKFPTEKAFMAKHGKEFKKAQGGLDILGGSLQDVSGNLRNIDGGFTRQASGSIPMMQGKGSSPLAVPALQNAKLAPMSPPAQGSDLLGQIGGMMNPATKIIGAIQKLGDEKKQRKIAEQSRDVSDLQLKASQTKDVDANRQLANNMTKKREMMMPVNTGEEFFPIYGVGTNALAKSGKKIKGQIANTYAPKTLYNDLGYEPLNDSKRKKAVSGTSVIGMGLDKITPAIYGDNAGADIGGTLGEAAGNLLGPVGGLVGKQVGQLAGWALDSNPRKMKKANDQVMRNANMMAMSNMDFNEASMRAGGHLKEYTPPSERALQTFDMGGDLKTHWGGYAEPISDNPYAKSPTVMFRGQSHDESDGKGRSGIGMTYGNSPVEVERGEPAQEFADGGKEKSLVVFGNLPISNTILPLLGDPDAKGKKFKNYVADLSKKEAVQNKIIDKSTNAINNLNPRTPFEKITFASHTANIKGANMNQQDLAQKKETAAHLQQAVNDAAKDHGLIADDLAKGKIKYAKLGTTLHKAVDGYKSKYGIEPWKGNASKNDKYGNAASEFTAEQWDSVADRLGFKGKGNKEFQEFLLQDPEAKSIINQRHQNLYGKDAWVDPKHFGAGWAAPELKQNNLPDYAEQMKISEDADLTGMSPIDIQNKTVDYNSPEKKKFPWMSAINSMIPYLRPSDAEQLDPRQITGEMFAMSQNQQEAVPLQTFQPQLAAPYDISFQDKLNENQATFRSAQRTMGYNPAAQANLAAQQYQANEGVLGEQFRANQSMKNQTYAQNRESLNQAQLRNLQAYDQQAMKQSQAKSNTKEVAQAALSSISDKFLKNRLEGRTLQTYENMYNYRFDPRMRAQNMNPLAEFDTTGANARPQTSGAIPEGMVPTYTSDDSGNPVKSGYKLKQDSKSKSRNGSIVSSFKNL